MLLAAVFRYDCRSWMVRTLPFTENVPAFVMPSYTSPEFPTLFILRTDGNVYLIRSSPVSVFPPPMLLIS